MNNNTDDKENFKGPIDMSSLAKERLNELEKSFVSKKKDDDSDESYKTDIDGRYVTIYFGMVRRFNLKTNEAILAHLIAALSKNKKGYCYMSKDNMSGLTHISGIYNVLASLEKKGVTEQKSIGKKRSPTHLRLTDEAKDFFNYCKKIIEDRKNEGYQKNKRREG